MKRKFIHLIALVAAFVSLGVFASCKDTDEDTREELNTKILDTRNALQVQIDTLDAHIKALEAWKTTITSCACDSKGYLDKAGVLALLQSSGYVPGSEISQSIIDALNGAMGSQIISIINQQIGAKNYDDAIATINEQIKTLVERRETIVAVCDTAVSLKSIIAQLTAVGEDLAQTSAVAGSALELAKTANALSTANASSIDSIAGVLKALEDKVASGGIFGYSDSLYQAYTNAAAALAQATNNYNTLVYLKETVLPAHSDSLKAVYDIIQSTGYFDNVAYIDSIFAVAEAHADSIDAALTQQVLAEAADARAYADTLFQQAQAYADGLNAEALRIIEERYGALDTKLTQVEAAYKEADRVIEGKVSELNGLLDDLSSTVGEHSILLAELTGASDAIKNSMAQLVTGVIIEEVYSPSFGSIVTPLGINSNLLVAFRGTFAGNSKGMELKFPTSDASNYVYQENALTAGDMKMIGSGVTETLAEAMGDVLISDAEDNAGRIYLTVNPTSIDFTGKVTPTLVNTRGIESGVKLGALCRSTKTKKFGYTRAGGFYEVPARVYGGYVQGLSLNVGGIKETIISNLKTLRNNPTSLVGNGSFGGAVSLSDIAANVYDGINGVIDAEGVQVSYTDPLTGTLRTITSSHDIAATSVTPLSYQFGKDFDYQNVPGYSRAVRVVNRLYEALLRRVRIASHDSELAHQMEKVNYDLTQLNLYNIDFEIIDEDNEYGEYLDPDDRLARVTFSGPNNEVTFTVSIKDISEDEIDRAEWHMDHAVEILKQALDDANKILGSEGSIVVTVNDVADEYASAATGQVLKYLDKVNKLLVSTVNSVNDLLLPCIVVRTADGTAEIKGIFKYAPVKVGSTFSIYPTSRTGELLAPAFKKHIAVTNVWNTAYTVSAQDGDAACKAALDAVNASPKFNKVLDGAVRRVEATGLKSGFVYEIALSCVDFTGVIHTEKCYVTVK